MLNYFVIIRHVKNQIKDAVRGRVSLFQQWSALSGLGMAGLALCTPIPNLSLPFYRPFAYLASLFTFLVPPHPRPIVLVLAFRFPFFHSFLSSFPLSSYNSQPSLPTLNSFFLIPRLSLLISNSPSSQCSTPLLIANSPPPNSYLF